MTKEQLAYLNGLDSKKEIKKTLNKWFGVEKIEVGKWVFVKTNTSGHINALVFNSNNSKTYGFNHVGNFTENYRTKYIDRDFIRYATDKEVKEALIKEAVKRGFKLGVYVKGMDDKERCKLFGDIKLFGNDCVNIGYDIFRSGKWAEIIETITKQEAEKKLNKKIID